MKYEYVLFDLDGTLTNPKEGITKSAQYALLNFGIEEPDLEKLTKFIGPPLMDSFQEFYGMTEEEAKKATAKYRERYEKIGLYENELIPEISCMLQKLKKAGSTLAVATSKPWIFAEKILEHFAIASYFSVVCGPELDGTRNAKADVIEDALKKLGIKAEDRNKAVMIGDRKHDIIGAQRCGLDSIGVEFGFAQQGELEKAGATYIIPTVKELEGFLLQFV